MLPVSWPVYFPELLSPTFCGLFVALSVRVRFAVRAPVAVGLNVRLITQPAPGFSVAVQVVDDIAKSPAFGPVMLQEKLMSAPVPVLVIVSAFGTLVLPTLVLPKLMLGGLRVTVGEFTVCDTLADTGLARKLVSPPYVAVRVLVLVVRKLIEQFPVATAPTHISPVLALTCRSSKLNLRRIDGPYPQRMPPASGCSVVSDRDGLRSIARCNSIHQVYR